MSEQNPPCWSTILMASFSSSPVNRKWQARGCPRMRYAYQECRFPVHGMEPPTLKFCFLVCRDVNKQPHTPPPPTPAAPTTTFLSTVDGHLQL
ncbi:uncharacterized protein LOC143271983 isoform X8 [Peromyscus maniculatus bairdii]|uniref:uncharacterized protein LOC143271983 isoform X8 n=1 Tax=Peromyscus maniculatus bairdii TaxID=230844 RepID=UPI003FD14DAF